jgi:phosphate transport system permease protein
LVNVNIRNLAGVPSIVYGILGLTIFVQDLEGLTGGRTLLAAGITLAILVLPIVIITSAEAVRAVPQPLREAAYGVGATRWEVTRSQVLPYALPGIITGTVLAVARAIGEAAPLLLTGAATGLLPGKEGLLDLSQLGDRFTALPIVIAEWARTPREGFDEIAAAAILLMLAIVLALSTVAILLRTRYEKKRT